MGWVRAIPIPGETVREDAEVRGGTDEISLELHGRGLTAGDGVGGLGLYEEERLSVFENGVIYAFANFADVGDELELAD